MSFFYYYFYINFINQEAAFDADKVFMAAIDKFNAMMSKGNVYAPDGMSKFVHYCRSSLSITSF